MKLITCSKGVNEQKAQHSHTYIYFIAILWISIHYRYCFYFLWTTDWSECGTNKSPSSYRKYYSNSVSYAQSTYRGRVDIGGVYLPSQLERTPQLFYVIVGIVKGGGLAPPPSPGWADGMFARKWSLPLCVLCGHLLFSIWCTIFRGVKSPSLSSIGATNFSV